MQKANDNAEAARAARALALKAPRGSRTRRVWAAVAVDLRLAAEEEYRRQGL